MENLGKTLDFIRINPVEADLEALDWNRFLKNNPQVYALNQYEEFVKWGKSKYINAQALRRLWQGKEITNAYFYLRDEHENKQMQETGEVDLSDKTVDSPFSSLLSLPLAFLAKNYDQSKTPEEDQDYKKIKDQKKSQWLEKNPGKDLLNQDGLDYVYGSLENNEPSSLEKETEEEFRKKHPEKAQKYDKEKKKVYKNINDDPLIINLKAKIEEETRARLDKFKEQESPITQKEIKEKVEKKHWQRFVKTNPEKTKAYLTKIANENHPLKIAYDSIHLPQTPKPQPPPIPQIPRPSVPKTQRLTAQLSPLPKLKVPRIALNIPISTSGVGQRLGQGLSRSFARAGTRLLARAATRAAGTALSAVGWPALAALGILLLLIIILLFFTGANFEQNGSINKPPFGSSNNCPDKSMIATNRKTTPQTCKYLNPAIDIFGDITLSQIQNYKNKYRSIANRADFDTRVDEIVKESRKVGLNPVIFLGYWKSEGNFSFSFGCDPRSEPFTFEAELTCALGLLPNERLESSATTFKHGPGSNTARCARSVIEKDPAKQQELEYACKMLTVIRADARYVKYPVSLPIKTFDDFAETYGSAAPGLGDAAVNYNCVNTYNTLVEIAIDIEACTATSSECSEAEGSSSNVQGGDSTNNSLVILDPGHGNPDPDPNQGKSEEGNLNLIIANKIKALLEKSGINTKLTHQGFIPIPDEFKNQKTEIQHYANLQKRVDIINSLNGSAFVSIHFDSGKYPGDKNPVAKPGPRTYYNNQRVELNINSQRLAEFVSSSISERTNSSLKGNVGSSEIDLDTNIGSSPGPLYILGPTGSETIPGNIYSKIKQASKIPGVLNEYFSYGRSYTEMSRDAEFVEKLSLGYCDGILKYMTSNPGAQCDKENTISLSPKPTSSETTICKGYKKGIIPPSNPATLYQDIKNKFGVSMEGFDQKHLQWAWEKFWEISNTRFINLIKGAIIYADNSSFQSSCKVVFLQQFKEEELFKIVLTHELGHIVRWCSPNETSRIGDLAGIISFESYVTYYSANAPGCTGSDNFNEDYAEMIAYYLNPESNSQTAACVKNNVGIEPNPYLNNKHPLHYNMSNKILR